MPATVRVPVAVTLATERFPEKKPLPCTESLEPGVEVPRPRFAVKLLVPVKVLLSARRVDDAAPAKDVRYVEVSTDKVPLADVFTKPADARLSKRRMFAVAAVKAVVEAYGKI